MFRERGLRDLRSPESQLRRSDFWVEYWQEPNPTIEEGTIKKQKKAALAKWDKIRSATRC